MSVSEKELVEGCRKGDRESMKRLYDIYAPKLLGLCYRYVGSQDVAQDMLHDGFITVYEKIHSYRYDGSFEGWMRRIFINTSLSFLRKNKKINFMGDDSMFVNTPNADISALEQLSNQELIDKINTLPQGFKTVLNLYAIEGYSHKEIGEMLGINESTSRSQYLRAKAQLNSKLGER